MVQKWKLENIEGVIRRYQKETTAVNRRTENAMSKSLEMSKGKSIMVRQIEYNQLYLLITPSIFSNFHFCTI
jgi:hypothetical protein